tara:strand:- start:1971 stop:2801 length:831 start_codon:yes stop_codon:yes gene_type:complete
MVNMRTISIGSVQVGPERPFVLIGGPCVAESLDVCLEVGEALKRCCDALGVGYIFKTSFDKANRSTISSGRGPGLEKGLELLADVRGKLAVPVTTDIHESSQAASVAQVIDLLQIPAFLCRQTDLLTAAAETGKPVNVKKGQFLSPKEMQFVVDKLIQSGGQEAGIMLTERGSFFGYHRLVNDFAGVGDLLDLGWPVCFDVTHSTQRPGAGATTGGNPQRATLLARCAVATGVQALFIETHPHPQVALSDAAAMLPLEVTLELLPRLVKLHQAASL